MLLDSLYKLQSNNILGLITIVVVVVVVVIIITKTASPIIIITKTASQDRVKRLAGEDKKSRDCIYRAGSRRQGLSSLERAS